MSLLLVYLEDKLNDQLEYDRNHAKKRFRLQSGPQLMFVSVLTAIQTYLAFPIQPSLRELIATPLGSRMVSCAMIRTGICRSRTMRRITASC